MEWIILGKHRSVKMNDMVNACYGLDDLTKTETAVLAFLASVADTDDCAHLSTREIEVGCRVGDRTARAAVNALREHGYISKAGMRHKDGKRASIFKISRARLGLGAEVSPDA